MRRALASSLALGLALAGCGGEEAPPPPSLRPTTVSEPSVPPPTATENQIPSGVLPPSDPSSSPSEEVAPSPPAEAAEAGEATAPARRRADPAETEAERELREATEAQAAAVGDLTEAQLERALHTLQEGTTTGVVTDVDDEIIRGASGYGSPPFRSSDGTGGQ